jgi:hypothetical protein
MQNSSKSQVIAKINFLEQQLISLDHYLPETYEYLMEELDVQRRVLAEIEVSETYKQIEAEQSIAVSGSSNSRANRHNRHAFSRAGVPNKKGQGT